MSVPRSARYSTGRARPSKNRSIDVLEDPIEAEWEWEDDYDDPPNWVEETAEP